jgi:hypothetical protein
MLQRNMNVCDTEVFVLLSTATAFLADGKASCPAHCRNPGFSGRSIAWLVFQNDVLFDSSN